jgi:hypothetical protein
MRIHAHHLKSNIPLMAATEEGIPPPLQPCDREYRKLAISPISAAPSTNRGNHTGLLRTALYAAVDRCMSDSAHILNTVIIIADKIPAIIEKPMQGKNKFIILSKRRFRMTPPIVNSR